MINTEVLIVGSGPSGISAAWPLVQAGVSVVMIDAENTKLPMLPDSDIYTLRNDPNRWKYYLGEDLGGLISNGDYSPKLSTPIARAVLEAGSRSTPEIIAKNMMSFRSANAGGLSSVWGAFCSAFDSNDMSTFPISNEDMFDAYERVAMRVGISGANDDLSEFHGSYFPLQDPVPLTNPAAHLLKKYSKSKRSTDFVIGRSRNAVITSDVNERSACNQCGLCLLGCSRKSIYNSAFEIPHLTRFPNFRYYKGMKLNRLASIQESSKVVEVDDNATIKSKYILLAAGTINTTALMMEYADMYGIEVGMLSNPVAGMAFVIPKMIGNKIPSQSFSLGQLSYKLSMSDNNDYSTGVVYGADTLPLNTFSRKMPFTNPASLRLSALLSPALLLVTVYLSGQYSNIKFIMGKSHEKNRFILEGAITNSAKNCLKRSAKIINEKLRGYGAYYIPGSFSISPPGSDAHLVGTIPMGDDGQLSCAHTCELNVAPGVFVVDGSWLPSLPAKHCTFTIMANAHRVGKMIAEDIKS